MSMEPLSALPGELDMSNAENGTSAFARDAYLGGAWRRMASVSVVRNALALRLRT